VPLWEHAAKWARRRPVHAAMAMLLGASMITVLTGLEWARVREKERRLGEQKQTDELRLALEKSRRSEKEASEQRALFDQERLVKERLQRPNLVSIASSAVDRGDFDAASSILDSLGPLAESHRFAWSLLGKLCRPRVKVVATLPQHVRTAVYR